MTATLVSPHAPESYAVIDDMDKEAFTYGDCWRLALAMNNMYGFPVAFYASVDPLDPDNVDDQTMWCHAFNVLPDGRLIDIHGVHTEDEMHASWNKHLWVDPGTMPMVFTPSVDGMRVMLKDFEAEYPEVDAYLGAQKVYETYYREDD